ncbi:MAG: hypothetical protein HY540_02260 [Deltaproteobacteria bacterium]|nr:hypothetical protein [Deltaproteobacteria bacterium]
MAKPRYRLTALLTFRERMKKRAEMELARAIKRLLEEKETLKKLEEQREDIRRRWKEARLEMKAAWGGGVQVGKGRVHVNFLRKLTEDEEEKKKEIEVQKGKIEEAEKKVASARRDYIDAAKELQIMEKHRELWVKKMQGMLSAREAKKLNELGTTIHRLKNWRGEKTVFEA